MRRFLVVSIATLVLGTQAGIALAWSAAGTGLAYSAATSMPAGGTPTVSVSGRNVIVAWDASTFPSGGSVEGYLVRRYDTTGIEQLIGAGCSGTVSGLTCTETAVPPGTWAYGVTARQGEWSGAEGPRSGEVTVDAASLTFVPPVDLSVLPADLGGTVSGFVTGETVTFRLDDAVTGAQLSGTIVPDPTPSSGTSSVTVTIPAGTEVGPHTVYAIGSSGSEASAPITVGEPDTTPPVVTAAAIGKTEGGAAGRIKQGGTFYVYVNAADPGTPSTGIASLTADVAAVTTGQTSVALAAGSYTVDGTTYGFRSAALTADNPLAAGTKAFSVAALDAAGNTTTQDGFSVAVDNTPPAGSNVQTANRAGGTAGRAEAGDTVTFTFSEAMDPNSIVAGWSGSATSVSVRILNQTGGSNDRLQVYDATNATLLPLGTLDLGSKGYVTSARTFAGSTMVLSGSTVTITLGTPSGTVGTVTRTGTMTWTPSAVATDLAGNACSAAPATEGGGADVEF